MRTSVLSHRASELRALEEATGYTKLAESMLIEQYCQEHKALPKHVALMKNRIQQGSSKP